MKTLKAMICVVGRFMPAMLLVVAFSSAKADWDEAWQMRFEELGELRARLDGLKRQFASENMLSEQLYELADLVALMDEGDRQAMAAALYGEVKPGDEQKWEKETVAYGDIAQQFIEQLRVWYVKNLRYQDLVNTHIAKKEAFVLEKSRLELLSIYKQLMPVQQQMVDNLYAELEQSYESWLPRKDLIAAVDPREQKKRLYSFHEFFETAQKIAQLLGLAGEQDGAQLLAARVSAQPASKSFPQLRMFLQVSVNLVKLMVGGYRSKFVRTIMSNARSWADIQGYDVEVQGRHYLAEALAESERSGQVFMFLPSHRSTTGDAVLLSKLGLDHGMAFANTVATGREICRCWQGGARWLGSKMSSHSEFAAEERVARWLGNKIADQPEVIGVADCRGEEQLRPTVKMLRSLKAQVSKVIVNYPQGFVTNSILPTNQAFSEKAVTPLYTEGFEPPLLVASYEIDSPFLSSDSAALAKGAMVKIHRPLPAPFVKLVLAWERRGMPQLLNMMIRSLWLDHTTVYPAMSLDEYARRISATLGLQILRQQQDVGLPAAS